MKSLQDKINYNFKNDKLLELALTHTSYANKRKREQRKNRIFR